MFSLLTVEIEILGDSQCCLRELVKLFKKLRILMASVNGPCTAHVKIRYEIHQFTSSYDLSTQILRPVRLVNSISPGSNVVPKLHLTVLELRDRLDASKLEANSFRLPCFEKVVLEKRLCVLLPQNTQHCRE